jgi:hypothetical protein
VIFIGRTFFRNECATDGSPQRQWQERCAARQRDHRLLPERSDAGALPEALRAQTFTDFEILLVDNASTDGAPQAAAAADPAIRFLQPGANLGFAAGNNLAAREARGRWLVLLNPDAYAGPTGWRPWSPVRGAIPRCAASPPCRWWPTSRA